MLDADQKALVDRYAHPVPRYTSYPTAPHFHDGVSTATYEDWLADIAPDARLSLYLHIPYCDRLCWFCGCHTKHTLKYEPITRYLEGLFAEINWVSKQLAGKGIVSTVHLGGGSPTLLTPGDMQRLRDLLRSRFTFLDDAEISIEIDPNDLGADRLDAMMDFGLTRASVGVQDFNHKVQTAINRPQTYEQTRFVIDGLRERGVRSINVDALYGLPFQTGDLLRDTIKKVTDIAPDRLALFGYAHVPWMKTHQRMIREDSLPDKYQRFEHAQMAARMLTDAGYAATGLDHFAKPADSLAQADRNGTLRRNFQGYTDDRADALIGLGASAIGKLPQGYVQNVVATNTYLEAVQTGGATARGIALSLQDRTRAFIIEQLMCRFGFDIGDLKPFGSQIRPAIAIARDIVQADRDGLVIMENGQFTVTGRGRPFVRSIAARFDTYFGQTAARHSIAV